MNPPFTVNEVEAIRQLATESDHPDDASIAAITKHDPNEIRSLIHQYLNNLRDNKINAHDIVNIFNSSLNSSPRRSPRLAPRPLEITRPNLSVLPPLSASNHALPPKYRSKILPSTPNPVMHNTQSPFSSNTNPLPPTYQNVQTANAVQTRIPVLPICEASPPMISHHKRDHCDPQIGSLAAVLHPSLGPAHVCRVLAKRVQNKTICYLVAFFQSGCSPCYVPSEYLFPLNAHVGFPLGNEDEFRQILSEEEISVDFLLERIFSSAQNLIINHAEVLFPQNTLENAHFQPEPPQVQQIMFQCVSCAALLLVCYVSCEWSIPKDKLDLITSTIMKTNPSKFTSTQNIMNKIQESLMHLIEIIGQ